MRTMSTKPVDAEQIAEAADHGEDVSAYFTREFTVVNPAVQRVDLSFSGTMLSELDREAEAVNISREAMIKAMLRESLDRRYLAEQALQAR